VVYLPAGFPIKQQIKVSSGQLSFVPVYCTDTLSPPEHANDSECRAICANTGQVYLCKKNSHPYLAASEWICSHLARACGLAVPNFAIVKVEGRDDFLFGSQWVEGALGWAVALPSVKNSNIFSQALALDYGVSNPDRHLENYLYFEKGGEVHVELIDFSRAFLVAGWPLPDLPMDEMNATIEFIARWQEFHQFVSEQANQVISRWLGLSNDYLKPVLDAMAPGWLDVPMSNRLLEWWASPARNQRANEAAYHLNYIK
jgi:hypothetical protein